MAAWLAYLKSRLLLPKPETKGADEPPAEEIAAALAFRLAKLDTMRKAAEALKERPQLGRDVFARGDPEAIRVVPSTAIDGDLYDLMRAYVDQRKAQAARHYRPRAPEAYPLEDARTRLRDMLPDLSSWTPLDGVAPEPEPGEDAPADPRLLPGLDPVGEPGAGEGGGAGGPPAGALRRPLSALAPAPGGGGVIDNEDVVAEPPALETSSGRSRPCCSPPPGRSSAADLARRLPEGADVAAAMAALQGALRRPRRGAGQVAGRWRFQTAEDLAFLMTEERNEPRRLSKAAQETLAIIAYHQPVTRAEIEAIRGVQASRGTLDVLLELGLVRMRGRRRSPGRPVTYGTTDAFLEHYGLASLADLPGVAEMKARRPARPRPAARLRRARSQPPAPRTRIRWRRARRRSSTRTSSGRRNEPASEPCPRLAMAASCAYSGSEIEDRQRRSAEGDEAIRLPFDLASAHPGPGGCCWCSAAEAGCPGSWATRPRASEPSATA